MMDLYFLICEVCGITWDHADFVEDDRLVECPECGAETMHDFSLPQCKGPFEEAC